jgi:hypothetical protein
MSKHETIPKLNPHLSDTKPSPISDLISEALSATMLEMALSLLNANFSSIVLQHAGTKVSLSCKFMTSSKPLTGTKQHKNGRRY